MRLLHSAAHTSAAFDAENVVSLAGLVPVMRLAQQAGLPDLIAERVRLDTSIGCNPAGKIAAIVAGMVAGADSIDDLDVLRHGGMDQLFGQAYAPSTLGSFLPRVHLRPRAPARLGRPVAAGLARRELSAADRGRLLRQPRPSPTSSPHLAN